MKENMKYKYQFKLFSKTFRFTKLFDNISRYSIGCTTRTEKGVFDSTYHFHRVLPGLYILSDNWLKPNDSNPTMEKRIVNDPWRIV